MEVAHFGIFEPQGAPGHHGQKPFFQDELPLSRQERDEAILTGKLPPQEQERDRRDEMTLAAWMALVNP